MNELKKRIKSLKIVVDIQKTTGNWDYDPYMHGMANGMILSLAIMEEKDPEFLEAPEKWINNK